MISLTFIRFLLPERRDLLGNGSPARTVPIASSQPHGIPGRGSDLSSVATRPTIGAAAALTTTDGRAGEQRKDFTANGGGREIHARGDLAWLLVNQWEPVPNTMGRT